MKLQQPILKAFLLGATVNGLGFVTLVNGSNAQTAPSITKTGTSQIAGTTTPAVAPIVAPAVKAPVAQVPPVDNPPPPPPSPSGETNLAPVITPSPPAFAPTEVKIVSPLSTRSHRALLCWPRGLCA